MLISNLGKTRVELFKSFNDLSDEEINQNKCVDSWSISQIIYHLYTIEKETAALILDALQTSSEKVEEKDLSFLLDRSKKVQAPDKPPTDFMTKHALIELLEESRFKHLQSLFNETHERTLLEKSMNHPVFGVISLKNVVDFIWLHEKRHIEQIYEVKQVVVIK